MNPSDHIGCQNFPCGDVRHGAYIVPDVKIEPQNVTIVMVSEAAPEDPNDYYYAGGKAAYERTTLEAFQDAGVVLDSFQEVLDLGIYLTSAVKCAKTGYGIKAATIKQCSLILEQELALFPKVESMLLMGDVAIKAINYIVKRSGEPRVIPAGSTYKIRGGEFFFREMRVFPSYLQVGPSFGIEKSKRRMIAEDIRLALEN
jgi:uracil-DNA glycosylase